LKRLDRSILMVTMPGRGFASARVEEIGRKRCDRLFAARHLDGGLCNPRGPSLQAVRCLRAGRILIEARSGGFRAWQGWGIYSATKFDVEKESARLAGYARELLPLGIRVTVIEPANSARFWMPARLLRSKQVIRTDGLRSQVASRQWADDTKWELGDPVKGGCRDRDLSLPMRNSLSGCKEAVIAWRRVEENFQTWTARVGQVAEAGQVNRHDPVPKSRREELAR